MILLFRARGEPADRRAGRETANRTGAARRRLLARPRNSVFAWLETLGRREDRYPPGPEGMVLYAVGDIHGRSDCLKRTHDLIDRDVAERSARDRALEISIGDYVDRGPDSKGVIDLLVARSLSASAAFEPVTDSATFR
jgi:serine/threonine protein phosphatase 1